MINSGNVVVVIGERSSMISPPNLSSKLPSLQVTEEDIRVMMVQCRLNLLLFNSTKNIRVVVQCRLGWLLCNSTFIE